mgnify:CR=1 FL=1
MKSSEDFIQQKLEKMDKELDLKLSRWMEEKEIWHKSICKRKSVVITELFHQYLIFFISHSLGMLMIDHILVGCCLI